MATHSLSFITNVPIGLESPREIQIARARTARCMLGLVGGTDRPAAACLLRIGWLRPRVAGGGGALCAANERTGCWGVAVSRIRPGAWRICGRKRAVRSEMAVRRQVGGEQVRCRAPAPVLRPRVRNGRRPRAQAALKVRASRRSALTSRLLPAGTRRCSALGSRRRRAMRPSPLLR